MHRQTCTCTFVLFCTSTLAAAHVFTPVSPTGNATSPTSLLFLSFSPSSGSGCWRSSPVPLHVMALHCFAHAHPILLLLSSHLSHCCLHDQLCPSLAFLIPMLSLPCTAALLAALGSGAWWAALQRRRPCPTGAKVLLWLPAS